MTLGAQNHPGTYKSQRHFPNPCPLDARTDTHTQTQVCAHTCEHTRKHAAVRPTLSGAVALDPASNGIALLTHGQSAVSHRNPLASGSFCARCALGNRSRLRDGDPAGFRGCPGPAAHACARDTGRSFSAGLGEQQRETLPPGLQNGLEMRHSSAADRKRPETLTLGPPVPHNAGPEIWI